MQKIESSCGFQAVSGTRSQSYQISKEDENNRSGAPEYGLRMGVPCPKSPQFFSQLTGEMSAGFNEA